MSTTTIGVDRDAVYRKISWRLLPFVLACYVINYLDRVSIGYAKLQFLNELHLNEAVFGLITSAFFVGYIAFEVPSNLLLLRIGAPATLTSVTLGIVWGAIAGFVGGRVDNAMMRIVDMMYAIPYLLIAILMVTLLGREFYLVVLTITVFSWMDMARVVRGQTLAIRSKEYIEAARAIGVSTSGIILRHIVPNLLGIVAIYTTVTVPGVILTESVLSFLGLGVQEPMTSWGVLIQDGVGVMETAPWILLFPAALLSVTLYCINFVGDGLRDALDPKDR